MTISPTYLDLAAGRGYAVLTGWSLLVVRGADAGKFLQNFCTNDVLKLAVGQSCEAFFTTAKAHIVAYGEVHRGAQHWLVLLSSPTAHELADTLERYIIREDVQLHVPGEELTCLLVPTAFPLSADIGPLERLPLVAWGPEWIVIAAPTRGVPVLQDLFAAAGLARADWDAWNTLRIELGAPLDQIDIEEKNLPQEVNRNQQAISFTKGCYLGQEPIARIDALGHVNQRLVSVKFTGSQIPPRGLELSFGEKVFGRVTSACWSPRLAAPLALAYVRRGANDLGAQLHSSLGAAEVVALPLSAEGSPNVLA